LAWLHDGKGTNISDSNTSVPDPDAAKVPEPERPVATPTKQGGRRMVDQELQKDLAGIVGGHSFSLR